MSLSPFEFIRRFLSPRSLLLTGQPLTASSRLRFDRLSRRISL